jgi:hypothetical protein
LTANDRYHHKESLRKKRKRKRKRTTATRFVRRLLNGVQFVEERAREREVIR